MNFNFEKDKNSSKFFVRIVIVSLEGYFIVFTKTNSHLLERTHTACKPFFFFFLHMMYEPPMCNCVANSNIHCFHSNMLMYYIYSILNTLWVCAAIIKYVVVFLCFFRCLFIALALHVFHMKTVFHSFVHLLFACFSVSFSK